MIDPLMFLALVPLAGIMPILGGSGKVLFWNSAGADSLLRTLYEGMGLTCHTQATWSTTLSDYRLIFMVTAPTADPSWWGEITGATWSGRLVICVDLYTGGMVARIDWLNGYSGTTGVTVGTGEAGSAGAGGGSEEGDDLTAGMSDCDYIGAVDMTGGVVLSYGASEFDEAWLVRSTVGDIDFVIVGDSSLELFNQDTKQFSKNLWNVSV